MYVYQDDLEKFIDWMKIQGVEVIRTNRVEEAFRIRTARGISIALKRADGTYIFTRELEYAWQAFRFGVKYRFSLNKTERKKMKVPVLVYELLKRDGDRCFYCDKKLKIQEIAMEHVCPISCGGPNHLSNMVLACKDCDAEVTNLPVAKKIKIRDRKRFGIKESVDEKLYGGATGCDRKSASSSSLRLPVGGSLQPPTPFLISKVGE